MAHPRPKETPNGLSIWKVMKTKQFNKYICPNNLVPIWKIITHKWKSNIFISFLNNHNYLLVICLYSWALYNFSNLEPDRTSQPSFPVPCLFSHGSFCHSNCLRSSFAKIRHHWKECHMIWHGMWTPSS